MQLLLFQQKNLSYQVGQKYFSEIFYFIFYFLLFVALGAIFHFKAGLGL